MKTLFTTALLMLLAGYVLAQQNFKPGYIINLQGDTIKGFINYKGEVRNALVCTFKPSDEAAATDFKPSELKAYGFSNGRLYQSVTGVILKPQLNSLNKFEEEPVEGQPTVNFMNVLVKGKASLFMLTDQTGQQHFYLQKDTAAVQQLYHLKGIITDPKTGFKQMYSSRQFTGIFTAAFQDCPSLTSLIQKTGFKESEMQKLVVAYNTCIDPDNEIRSVERPKSKATWGGLAGLTYSNVKISDGLILERGDYKSAPAITAGLYLNITTPQLNEKLSVQNSLMFVRRNYRSDFDISGTDVLPYWEPGTPPNSTYSYHYNYRVTFNLDYIELASQIRYTVPEGTVRPFISAGLSLGQVIKQNQALMLTYTLDNDEPKQHPTQTDFMTIRKTEQGFIGAVGAVYNLPSKKQLTLETRLHRSNGFIRYWDGRTKTHTLSVLLGLQI